MRNILTNRAAREHTCRYLYRPKHDMLISPRKGNKIMKITDYIRSELSPSEQKIALDFADFMENQGLEFEKDEGYWKDKIYYIIKFQDECICFIAIKDPDEPGNNWTVWSDDMDSISLKDYPIEEKLREVAWSHADGCGNCGSCGGGKPKVIFGKDFPKVCECTFRIDNPNAEDLQFMKKMVEIRKNEILSHKK